MSGEKTKKITITGFRNLIIYEYPGTDYQIIRQIIQNSLKRFINDIN